MLAIPLANLNHVNDGLRVLISTKWGVKPCDIRVRALVGHRVDENGRDFDG